MSGEPGFSAMKDKRELSGDQKPVASDSPVAILVLLPPSMSATHSSLRSLAGTVMYITFFPSGEIEGCVAFSAATSVNCLVRVLYAVKNPEDLPLTK